MLKKLSFAITLGAVMGQAALALAQYMPPSPPGSPSPVGGVTRPQATVPAVPTPPRPSGNPNIPPPPPADLMQSQIEKDILAQSDGKFPILERSASYSLGALQRAWNSPFAASGQASPGVMRYTWRPDFVMAVRTREYMVTTINLPPWEQVTNIIVGDPVVFDAKRIRPHILAIRPSHGGADTNVTVIGGSGNIYTFYIRSENWNSDQVSDLTVFVEANRPQNLSGGATVNDLVAASIDGQVPGNGNGGANSNTRLTPPDYVREIAFKPENLRFDMKILAPTANDTEIAPERVFNDGIWTYFDFGKKADYIRRPVVYQVVDGVDTMVNTRTAGPTGNILIAETVGDFTMRNGNRVVCIHRTDRPLPQRSSEFNDRMRLSGPAAPNQVVVMRPPQPGPSRPMGNDAGSVLPSFFSGIGNWFGDAQPATNPPISSTEK